jgi:hypothetical protein
MINGMKKILRKLRQWFRFSRKKTSKGPYINGHEEYYKVFYQMMKEREG